jgi:hypothetical protein
MSRQLVNSPVSITSLPRNRSVDSDQVKAVVVGERDPAGARRVNHGVEEHGSIAEARDELFPHVVPLRGRQLLLVDVPIAELPEDVSPVGARTA